MKRATQAIVLTLVGATLLRLSLTDEHLLFVKSFMRWPLLATGIAMLGLSLRLQLQREDPDGHDDHEHAPPRATWLLILPALVLFVTAPPALGAYVLDRDVNRIEAPAEYDAPVVAGLPEGDVVPLSLLEFITRAQFDAANSLTDRTVELTGFVSSRGDRWFVSRLSIQCCAADALGYQVEVRGAPKPADDQWIRVTGTWVTEDSPTPRNGTPALTADEVIEIAAPKDPYE